MSSAPAIHFILFCMTLLHHTCNLKGGPGRTLKDELDHSLSPGIPSHRTRSPLDPRRCSHENSSMLSRGLVGDGMPLCQAMLLAISKATRPAHDGPLAMLEPKTLAPCTFQWFLPEAACSLLSSPPTMIVYIGDSLTRHASHGMQLLVRNDIVLGALREDLPANVSEACTCNRQFAVKGCRSWILKDTLNTTSRPCPGARVVYVGAETKEELNVSDIARLAIEQPRSFLMLGGWGMHNNLEAQEVYKHLVKPLRAATRRHRHVQLMCLGIHALQDNVPEKYKAVHNNDRVGAFNRAFDRKCSHHRLPFVDTFRITVNATSFDGIHYGLEVNLLKAQLLLNLISSIYPVLPPPGAPGAPQIR